MGTNTSSPIFVQHQWLTIMDSSPGFPISKIFVGCDNLTLHQPIKFVNIEVNIEINSNQANYKELDLFLQITAFVPVLPTIWWMGDTREWLKLRWPSKQPKNFAIVKEQKSCLTDSEAILARTHGKASLIFWKVSIALVLRNNLFDLPWSIKSYQSRMR